MKPVLLNSAEINILTQGFDLTIPELKRLLPFEEYPPMAQQSILNLDNLRYTFHTAFKPLIEELGRTVIKMRCGFVSKHGPLAVGQGCPCGLNCGRYTRPKYAAERTVSYRKRAGSRRTKKLARKR